MECTGVIPLLWGGSQSPLTHYFIWDLRVRKLNTGLRQRSGTAHTFLRVDAMRVFLDSHFGKQVMKWRFVKLSVAHMAGSFWDNPDNQMELDWRGRTSLQSTRIMRRTSGCDVMFMLCVWSWYRTRACCSVVNYCIVRSMQFIGLLFVLLFRLWESFAQKASAFLNYSPVRFIHSSAFTS